jgi:hypothetical protein
MPDNARMNCGFLGLFAERLPNKPDQKHKMKKQTKKLALIRTRIKGVTRYKMPASLDEQSIDFVKRHRTESREVIKNAMRTSLKDINA